MRMALWEENFDPDPEAARAVRHLVQESLPEGELRDDVMLVASELASNVIRYARTDFTVRLETEPDLVRIEVWDGSSIIHAMKDLTDSERELRIIEALSHRWGIESLDGGKTVWAEFRPHQFG